MFSIFYACTSVPSSFPSPPNRLWGRMYAFHLMHFAHIVSDAKLNSYLCQCGAKHIKSYGLEQRSTNMVCDWYDFKSGGSEVKMTAKKWGQVWVVLSQCAYISSFRHASVIYIQFSSFHPDVCMSTFPHTHVWSRVKKSGTKSTSYQMFTRTSRWHYDALREGGRC